MTNRFTQAACEGYRVTVDLLNGCLSEIAVCIKGEMQPLLTAEYEFVTTPLRCGGRVETEQRSDCFLAQIQADNEFFAAKSIIRLDSSGVTRTQEYRIKKEFVGRISPHFTCRDLDAKYTYPQRVYDLPLRDAPALCNDYVWALPLPAHMWHKEGYAAAYGLDRRKGKGTCEIEPVTDGVLLGCCYPDRTAQESVILPFSDTKKPGDCAFVLGETIVFSEFFAYAPLSVNEHPLLRCERLVAERLLNDTNYAPAMKEVAEGIAQYYQSNDLWEANAFGEGFGWYRNMWKHTDGGIPEKDFYYDLGWGEGFGVLTLSALVRYSLRQNTKAFHEQIQSITRSLPHFLRDKTVPGGYYDRFIPKGCPSLLQKYLPYQTCDFLGARRIWTHSLAMIGYQLLSLSQEAGEYDIDLQRVWQKTAEEIAGFLLDRQGENGDIQDGFLEDDSECNKKKHRIPARACACALFAGLYRLTKEERYLRAGVGLARAVAPEIERYQFFNQMLDAHVDVVNGQIVDAGQDENAEVYDAENACYAFLGLVELYESTKSAEILRLCENCAAYFISWMYFYDLPSGVNQRTRGATTCRMPDFPLVYLGAGNFAYSALMKLAALTEQPFYGQIAQEMLNCSADYQIDRPHKPWNKGIVHAVYQVTGKHWGPDIEGQMDTGMTSGSTWINLEKVLAEKKR